MQPLRKFKCGQSEDSYIEVQDKKAQHVHFGGNRWQRYRYDRLL